MVGENYSYIYLGAGNVFNFADSYSVEITRQDGSKMFSCPLRPEVIQDEYDIPIVVSPDGNN